LPAIAQIVSPAAAWRGRKPLNRRANHVPPRMARVMRLLSVAAAVAADLLTTLEVDMLYYAIVFFVIALVAALFGFGGIAAGAAGIAKILFFAFLVIAIVTFLMSLARRA
jgi:uncharacterized membrane protein YtjA (UPF0391 family)